MNDTERLRARFQAAQDGAMKAEALFAYLMDRCPRVVAWLERCVW